MKNTLENKAKFFAQYYGQEVLKATSMQGIHRVGKSFMGKIYPDQYLELKPISQISDEDAIHVAKHVWSNAWRATEKELIETGRYRVERNRFGSFEAYFQDYFRSKGYAVQYLDVSIEDQIEYGWIKYCQNDQGK